MNKKTVKDAGGDQGPPGKDMPVKINPEINYFRTCDGTGRRRSAGGSRKAGF